MTIAADQRNTRRIPGKPKVIVTRRLMPAVEARMGELFDAEFNADDSPMDRGALIAAKDIPYLFERFFRADRSRSRSRDAGGAGIGLAIVKELIEAHGGSVGAASDESGTRVWFALPKTEEGKGEGLRAKG